MTSTETKKGRAANAAMGTDNGSQTVVSPQDTTESAESQVPTYTDEMIANAFVYHTWGWSVIPLQPKGKRPLVKWDPFQSKRASQDELTSWGKMFPTANLGIVTGAISNLVVLDVDGPEGEAEVKRRGLPPTPMVRTGKGKHYYFRHPGGTIQNFARKWPGLDLRGDGGYVVAPPSIHENGTTYTWQISPDDADLSNLPDWLLESICKTMPTTDMTPKCNGHDAYAEAALADELKKLASASEGTRNNQLNRASFSLGQFVAAGRLDRGAVEQSLTTTALTIGLETDEIEATIKSGLDSGTLSPRLATGNNGTKAEPTGFKRTTDYGNAERLVSQHGDKLKYCYAWGRWLAWTGRRWAIDETGAVIRLAKATVRSIYAEAAAIEDDEIREKVAKWAHRSESKTRIDAMLTLAQSEKGISVKPEDLDANPWHLNTLTGTLDLRTGELRPHQANDLITKIIPVAYNPSAECPTWDGFLRRIMDNNNDLIQFLQREVGYSLTGDTSEQCFFIHYGTGANGKTTFSNAIGDMLGDYAQQTPASTLLAKRNDTIPNDVARLKGARLVTVVEADEGRWLAEALVKQMTGGDRIAARFMRQEWFEFTPNFKILLGTNHKPTIRGTDYAMWRRIRLIPFTVTIPENEQDKALLHKLRSELPGILNWAIEGCQSWQRSGLDPPEEVKVATKAYKTEMDVISQFLEDCTRQPDEDDANADLVVTRAGELYKAYQEWCSNSGEKAINRTRFGRALGERGFEKGKDKQNYVIYLRLGLSGSDSTG